jgi:hypothetical protein
MKVMATTAGVTTTTTAATPAIINQRKKQSCDLKSINLVFRETPCASLLLVWYF